MTYLREIQRPEASDLIPVADQPSTMLQWVEIAGGAMLRVVLPGGVGITHQWTDEADAQPQIRAALASLHTARVSAKGVGDDGK